MVLPFLPYGVKSGFLRERFTALRNGKISIGDKNRFQLIILLAFGLADPCQPKWVF
jgi:hypothetical protein